MNNKVRLIFILDGKEYARKLATVVPRVGDEVLFRSEPSNTMIVELVVFDYITEDIETVNIGLKRR